MKKMKTCTCCLQESPAPACASKTSIKKYPLAEQQFEYLKDAESVPIDEQSLQDLVEEKLSPQDFRKKLRDQ